MDEEVVKCKHCDKPVVQSKHGCKKKYCDSYCYNQFNKASLLEKNKIYRKNNRERILITKAKYRGRNRKKVNEAQKRYYQKNKEKINLKALKNYHENKDKICAKAKYYRNENKEKINAKTKIYRNENKEKIKDYKKKYRQKYSEINKKYYDGLSTEKKCEIRKRDAENYRKRRREKKKNNLGKCLEDDAIRKRKINKNEITLSIKKTLAYIRLGRRITGFAGCKLIRRKDIKAKLKAIEEGRTHEAYEWFF